MICFAKDNNLLIFCCCIIYPLLRLMISIKTMSVNGDVVWMAESAQELVQHSTLCTVVRDRKGGEKYAQPLVSFSDLDIMILDKT